MVPRSLSTASTALEIDSAIDIHQKIEGGLGGNLPVTSPPDTDSTDSAFKAPQFAPGSTDQAASTPNIKYRVEYRDERNVLVHSRSLIDRDRLIEKSHNTIFEIVTTYRTTPAALQSENSGGEQKTHVVVDTKKKVHMVIHSPAIIRALRAVVKYYPGQNLLEASITIPSPYPVLVHHEQELLEYRERCNPATRTIPLCDREKDAYEHLKILFDFLEESVMPMVRLERERNLRNAYTWEMVWLSHKPGSTWNKYLFGDDFSGTVQFVVESVEGGLLGFGGDSWSVNYWYLDCDGNEVGRCKSEEHLGVAQFDGEREWSEENQPIDDKHFKNLAGDTPVEQDKKVTEIIAQGKKMFSLLNGKCQQHHGLTDDFLKRKVDGLVFTDLKSYYLHSPKNKPTVTRFAETNLWLNDCTCSVCKEEEGAVMTKTTNFSGYDGIDIEEDMMKDLTDHQYFLLKKTLPAYVFKTRSPGIEMLKVENLSEPSFTPEMIDTLVLDTSRLKIIKALAGSYIRENVHKEKSPLPPWNADFVEGKGQGQIFLLHGKPGVGKTYTAECIAQYTKRPLMILTSSDIGTNPGAVERNLQTNFKRAATWGAILLIDEADVFMEQRSTNDLERNSLVAGFLRALEFYDGLLFLTTNRVGTFDDAFISRIHLKIHYPDFTDEERSQIWKTFMDKLVRDRGSSIRVSIDAKDYIKGREIKAVKWNGREIRNAFQTAVALAEYEAEKDEEGKILLKDTHLSAIVEMSQDFKKYLDDLHLGDEDKRALKQGIRLDK